MTGKGGLTVEAMKELWKKEFLPSIRREMKAEIDSVKTDIKKIEARFDKIEESQAFLSDKYDGIIETLQSSKKQAAAAEAKAKDQDKEIYNLQCGRYEHDAAIDELQQYSRRDCLEITGIPIPPIDNPKKLVQELASTVGVTVQDDQISTAHRLPSTKKVKHRIIVKFTQRWQNVKKSPVNPQGNWIFYTQLRDSKKNLH